MTNHLDDLSVPPVDDRLLYELISGRRALPVVTLTQELGLFEHLSDRPEEIDEIAKALKITTRAAEALVAVSASLGFLERRADGRFLTTELSRTYLLPTSPFYYPPLELDNPVLDRLRLAVRDSREPVAPVAVAIDSLDPEDIREFITWMHVLSLPAASALAEQEVFRQINTVLDVGAGSGSLSCAIAKKNPGIRCTAMDLERVCSITRENIQTFGLNDRVQVIIGNMFEEPWPKGHDAILFGNIFHDWDMETCKRLATLSYHALEPGGRILLHEIPIDDTKDGPLVAACWSVSMLLHEKGKQYSPGEFEEMLTEAGFVDFQSTPTFGYYHLISAMKP